MFKFYSMQWMVSKDTKYILNMIKWLKLWNGPLCWDEDGWVVFMKRIEAAVDPASFLC